MTRLSDDLGQTPTPDRPAAPVNPPPAATRNETSEAVASPSGEEDRFAKCHWLFRKGNKASVGNKNAAKQRMEHLIQRLTNNGDVIVQFFCAVASGQPFVIREVEKLPRTKEQEAVAQGIATPEQKAAAKKQRRFIVTRRPHYPSMAEVTEAFKWLADRGFGKAPKTVQSEGSVTTGFKMVFRKWAPGTDPASLPMAEMPKQIVVSARVLDIKPTDGTNGKNGKP